MLEAGRRFGRYEIRKELGAGGMGEVSLAFDTMLQRLVALKIVRRDKNKPEAVTRLFSEARSAAALRHPNAVTLLDAGEIDGIPFLAMEYVEGETLRAYVGASGDVAPKLEWLKQLASVLAAAHAANIVHRDVKPENVIVAKDDGQIRVLDFGIAKRIIAADTSAPTSDVPMSVRTAEGRVIGTSAYMAPEQRSGGAPSPLWDQYAWAVTAYELLSGMRPATSDVALLHNFLPQVPVDVSLTIARAMSRDPPLRHADMLEVARALGATTGALIATPEPNAATKNIATTTPLHATPEPTSPKATTRSLFIVAFMAFTVGAALVAAFMIQKARHASVVVASASANASVSVVVPAATASASASFVTASVEPSATSSAFRDVAPATDVSAHGRVGTMGCLCRATLGNNTSLCAREKLGITTCRCETSSGVAICPNRWTNDDSPTCADLRSFGNTITTKDGDACEGFTGDTDRNGKLMNTQASGGTVACQACTVVETYFGMEGDACEGYRNDRTHANGVVDCDNLRYACRWNRAACIEAERRSRKK